MTTWRTHDSASPLFKPRGSIPSPREHSYHLAVKQGVSFRNLEPQPSVNAPVVERDTEPQWAISMQEKIKEELSEVSTKLCWEKVRTLIPQVRSSVARVKPPPDTWDDEPVPPLDTQFAVPAKTSGSPGKIKIEQPDQQQGTIPNTQCKECLGMLVAIAMSLPTGTLTASSSVTLLLGYCSTK